MAQQQQPTQTELGKRDFSLFEGGLESVVVRTDNNTKRTKVSTSAQADSEEQDSSSTVSSLFTPHGQDPIKICPSTIELAKAVIHRLRKASARASKWKKDWGVCSEEFLTKWFGGDLQDTRSFVLSQKQTARGRVDHIELHGGNRIVLFVIGDSEELQRGTEDETKRFRSAVKTFFCEKDNFSTKDGGLKWALGRTSKLLKIVASLLEHLFVVENDDDELGAEAEYEDLMDLLHKIGICNTEDIDPEDGLTDLENLATLTSTLFGASCMLREAFAPRDPANKSRGSLLGFLSQKTCEESSMAFVPLIIQMILGTDELGTDAFRLLFEMSGGSRYWLGYDKKSQFLPYCKWNVPSINPATDPLGALCRTLGTWHPEGFNPRAPDQVFGGRMRRIPRPERGGVLLTLATLLAESIDSLARNMSSLEFGNVTAECDSVSSTFKKVFETLREIMTEQVGPMLHINTECLSVFSADDDLDVGGVFRGITDFYDLLTIPGGDKSPGVVRERLLGLVQCLLQSGIPNTEDSLTGTSPLIPSFSPVEDDEHQGDNYRRQVYSQILRTVSSIVSMAVSVPVDSSEAVVSSLFCESDNKKGPTSVFFSSMRAYAEAFLIRGVTKRKVRQWEEQGEKGPKPTSKSVLIRSADTVVVVPDEAPLSSDPRAVHTLTSTDFEPVFGNAVATCAWVEGPKFLRRAFGMKAPETEGDTSVLDLVARIFLTAAAGSLSVVGSPHGNSLAVRAFELILPDGCLNVVDSGADAVEDDGEWAQRNVQEDNGSWSRACREAVDTVNGHVGSRVLRSRRCATRLNVGQSLTKEEMKEAFEDSSSDEESSSSDNEEEDTGSVFNPSDDDEGKQQPAAAVASSAPPRKIVPRRTAMFRDLQTGTRGVLVDSALSDAVAHTAVVAEASRIAHIIALKKTGAAEALRELEADGSLQTSFSAANVSFQSVDRTVFVRSFEDDELTANQAAEADKDDNESVCTESDQEEEEDAMDL